LLLQQIRNNLGRDLMGRIYSQVLEPSHFVTAMNEDIDVSVVLRESKVWNNRPGAIVSVEDRECLSLDLRLGNVILAGAEVANSQFGQRT